MANYFRYKLRSRLQKGILRNLPQPKIGDDFLSNDYLGLAKNQQLRKNINSRIEKIAHFPNGGTGSRLLSGNHKYYDILERYLNDIFRSESSLVFNSGYTANLALMASVADRQDTLLFDRLSHASLIEGCRLSRGNVLSFKHNDVIDLEKKMSECKGNIYVVTESVFSMDGDEAPLEIMVDLCKKYKAHLIVDEAHSTGIYGNRGSGWIVNKNLEKGVFARIHTFGKAMGVHGACIVGNKDLIHYLINYGKSFIYTTSLPPHSVIAIEEAFKYLSENMHLQNLLFSKINLFKTHITTQSNTPIQPIITSGTENVLKMATLIQQSGFDVLPILYPTVKEGTERMRICIHTFNSDKRIVSLAEKIKSIA